MASPSGPRALASAYESPTFGEDSSFHIDLPVGSMSISPCGRDVVLASKEGLHVIDLDNPYSPPRYLPHHTPWEVADVQWSPFAARDSWVVSTSNQKALVWNLAMNSWENSIEHILHAHSRAITDINFSAHHPDVIATCAVDSFVHCWDLRIPTRPVVSFSDWFAGATQVKWNRQDEHVIASSHDRFLRIWDDRKGAYPLRTIEAHSTKIYGVDWNRIRPEALVTCSLDRTVKFWDYSVEVDAPEKVIEAPFPVWRARNTPFGWGVLAMPQRGNSDLHLYSRRAKTAEEGGTDELPLVHSFPGHKGQVKEFLWRPRGTVIDGMDHREFQLVSWGTDKELRLHRVNPDVLKGVGYEEGKSFNPSLNITRQGAAYKTFRDEPVVLQDNDVPDNLPDLRDRAFSSKGHSTTGISMPYSRAWNQAGTMGPRIGVRGKSAFRADMNPISWMRGVKISGWDVETLGDEITHVGEKFTKVAFEFVHVNQRKATVSMHGPWGPDGTNLFLKIDIKFPPDYPSKSIPVFNVQKTAAMTKELASTITSGLRTISGTYVSRKRGCMEGVLRYLLGEHSVEEIVSLVKSEDVETVKSPDILGGDESSDEDEEVDQFAEQDLGLSSSELLRPNVMVPVARICGARWANDGRLVCFFPQKREKLDSFLGSMGLREMTRMTRSDKVFEAFGRLRTGSPGPKRSTGAGTGTGGGTATDDAGSDYSDDSSNESVTSSGSSSDFLSTMQPQFNAPNTWRSGSIPFHRGKSLDNSQKSTTGIGTVKSGSDNSRNSIQIYDFSDLLPAKRSLAKQYKIFGDRPSTCEHNMNVAASSGHPDVAYVWGLVKLMLQTQIFPDVTAQSGSALAARRTLNGVTRRDSGVDMNYDFNKSKGPPILARSEIFKWGSHPLGGHWLVPALFAYFEQLADVQMLGMLSCILHETETKRISTKAGRRSSIMAQNPTLTLDYSPPTGDSEERSQFEPSLASVPKDSNLLSTSLSSACSSIEPWQTGTPPLYSTGTTPPTAFQGAGRKSQLQPVSLAGSPDQHSNPRTSSNFGSTLASSLSKSFTFGPSVSPSPPSNSSKKRPSPAGSLNVTGPSGWTTGGVFGRPASAVPDYVTASTTVTSRTHSDTESERQSSPKSKSGCRAKVVLKNQEEFDSEGQAYVPLLDPKQESLFKAYRAAYADLLFAWDMPVERSEVLRVGGMSAHRGDGRRQRQNERRVSVFAHDESQPSEPGSARISETNNGLDIQSHCPTCGYALHVSAFLTRTSSKGNRDSGNGPGDNQEVNCPRCKPIQPMPTSMSCVVCCEAVGGMFVPCLNCGHITCRSCHQQWFSVTPEQSRTTKDNPGGQTPSCPSGCDCHCSENIVIDVPMPPSPRNETPDGQHHPTKDASRSRSRRRKPVDLSRFGRSSLDQPTQNEGSQTEGWPGSSIASLARGLSGGLTLDLNSKKHSSRRSGTSSFGTGWSGMKNTLDRVDTM